jgi:hypothetical protein
VKMFQHNRSAGCRQMTNELLLNRRCRCWLWERKRKQGDRFDNIKSSPAQKLLNGGFAQAGSIVLNTNHLLVFAELDAANAVNFADFGNGKNGCLGGARPIAIEDVKLGHKTMIAAVPPHSTDVPLL